MRIIVISAMYPRPKQHEYGIFVHQQVKALIKEGYHVKVISPIPYSNNLIGLFSKSWYNISKIPFYTRHEGIDVYHPRCFILPKKLNFKYYYKHYLRAIDRVLKTTDIIPDIIHAHTAYPDSYSIIKNKSLKGIPVVTTIHGSDFNHNIYQHPWLRKRYQEVYDLTSVVTVSSRLWEHAGLFMKINHNKKVIPNGIVRESIKPCYLKNNTIVFAGNLKPTKGADILIRAFSQLPENIRKVYKVEIIGLGPELYRLKALCKKLKINRNIKFLGQIPHGQVLAHMNRARVFVVPSWVEGFGLVYLEAMSQGTPIIACQGEGISDILIDKKHGWFVEKENVENLRDILTEACSNIKKLENMGKKAQKLVLNKYTWEVNVKRYGEIYKELVNKKNIQGV